MNSTDLKGDELEECKKKAARIRTQEEGRKQKIARRRMQEEEGQDEWLLDPFHLHAKVHEL